MKATSSGWLDLVMGQGMLLGKQPIDGNPFRFGPSFIFTPLCIRIYNIVHKLVDRTWTSLIIMVDMCRNEYCDIVMSIPINYSPSSFWRSSKEHHNHCDHVWSFKWEMPLLIFVLIGCIATWHKTELPLAKAILNIYGCPNTSFCEYIEWFNMYELSTLECVPRFLCNN